MARAIWQKTVTDNTGAPSNGAQVTVNIQDGGPATIFSLQEGGTSIANPFVTGIDGIARFYAERGYYTVTVFKDNSSVSFPWNNLGDKNLFDDLANTAFVESTDYAQTLLADEDATEARATLELGTAALLNPTAYAQSLLDDNNASDARATLELGSAALVNASAYGAALIDDADAAAARTTLGLGTAAVKNVNDMGALGTGVITATADAVVNGLTVGRGAGNILTNVAIGENALLNNTTGNFNNAGGHDALLFNTTGSNNNASGVNALRNNTTGSGNTAINPQNAAGSYAPVFNPTTQDNRFIMGSTGVTNAYIQVAWTVVSDERDKAEFAPVPHGLDFVNQLKPTAYKYKMNREDEVGHGMLRYGFKAQDVLAIEGDNPVIVDNEDSEKLRMVETSLIPVLVNAINELTARVAFLEGK